MDGNTFKDDSSDQFPDISDPVEYKDAPITFTLHEVRGRQEEIKIVEPELDYPLPEDDRLVVAEKDARLTDVVFKFNPTSDRPYELHFKVLMGIAYPADHLIVFGTSMDEDKDLLSVYKMEIVNRGGVKAWIEMTQGKARLVIKYEGQARQNTLPSAKF
jgi:hypothetical protein